MKSKKKIQANWHFTNAELNTNSSSKKQSKQHYHKDYIIEKG